MPRKKGKPTKRFAEPRRATVDVDNDGYPRGNPRGGEQPSTAITSLRRTKSHPIPNESQDPEGYYDEEDSSLSDEPEFPPKLTREQLKRMKLEAEIRALNKQGHKYEHIIVKGNANARLGNSSNTRDPVILQNARIHTYIKAEIDESASVEFGDWFEDGSNDAISWQAGSSSYQKKKHMYDKAKSNEGAFAVSGGFFIAGDFVEDPMSDATSQQTGSSSTQRSQGRKGR